MRQSLDIIWPDFSLKENTISMSRFGAGALIVVGIVTAISDINGIFDQNIRINEIPIILAVVYFTMAFGISKFSRIAALLGFILFLSHSAMVLQTNYDSSTGFGVFFFGLILLNTIRGTFAYHKYKSVENDV